MALDSYRPKKSIDEDWIKDYASDEMYNVNYLNNNDYDEIDFDEKAILDSIDPDLDESLLFQTDYDKQRKIAEQMVEEMANGTRLTTGEELTPEEQIAAAEREFEEMYKNILGFSSTSLLMIVSFVAGIALIILGIFFCM